MFSIKINKLFSTCKLTFKPAYSVSPILAFEQNTTSFLLFDLLSISFIDVLFSHMCNVCLEIIIMMHYFSGINVSLND